MHPFIIVDVDGASRALLRELFEGDPLPGVWGAKIGDDLIRHGLRDIHSRLGSTKIFVDLKHYDTPDRLKRQVAMYAELGSLAPAFLTISGDVISAFDITALRSAVSERGTINIIVTGPLSSWDENFCRDKYSESMSTYTQLLVRAACDAGAQGITCPAWILQEDDALREDIYKAQAAGGFLTIATGIRSAGIPKGNHVHPRTAATAMQHGATHVVVGSEVTGVAPLESRQRLMAMYQSVANLAPGSIVNKRV